MVIALTELRGGPNAAWLGLDELRRTPLAADLVDAAVMGGPDHSTAAVAG
jgi:hypothetical protein